jgi:hypothetical protein
MTGRVVVREYTQSIHGTPEEVFPLLCPVREGEWLEGWSEHCRLVQSVTGVAEPGCVFITVHPGEPETVWMVTRHVPAEGIVEFCHVQAGVEAVSIEIAVTGAQSPSSVAIRYTAVPLPGADLVRFEERWSQLAFDEDVGWWEHSMNHYLATGAILRYHA